MVTIRSRLPRAAHTSRAWRIHEVIPDFEVLDVWELPTHGGRDDFSRLVALIASFDAERSSPLVHALFTARWALGRLLGWDGPADGIDSRVTTLRDRLPQDLVPPSPGIAPTGRLVPLYVAEDEAALEIANRTMHGVLHLGWVPDGNGGFRGQMTVLVKPNGLLGAGYLAAISPFRHLVVYPTMLRTIGRIWRDEKTVSQIEPPQDARALCTLPRIDYADAFLVQTDSPSNWTAERWAMAILEQAPAAMRARLISGWAVLGLKLETGAESDSATVLGWPVRRNTPDVVLLGADSRIGMPAQLLVLLRPGGVLFATFLHHQSGVTRPLWAAIERTHLRVVAELLGRAAASAAATVSGQGVGGTASAGGGASAGSAAGAGSGGEVGTFGPGA